MAATDSEYTAVVEQVSRWPAAQRSALIHELLRTLAADRDIEEGHSPSKRRDSTLTHAIGLFKGEGPAPSDAQIQQLLAERRLEKFG